MKAIIVPIGQPSNKPPDKTHWCGLDEQVVSDYRQSIIAVCRYRSWKETNEDEGMAAIKPIIGDQERAELWNDLYCAGFNRKHIETSIEEAMHRLEKGYDTEEEQIFIGAALNRAIERAEVLCKQLEWIKNKLLNRENL